jgi:hypothetical protein
VTAPGFAVVPIELCRAASALADVHPPGVPDPTVDSGWAATVALDSVVAAATDRVARLAAETAALAGALDRAARGYEWCDADAADRVRAALRDWYVR